MVSTLNTWPHFCSFSHSSCSYLLCLFYPLCLVYLLQHPAIAGYGPSSSDNLLAAKAWERKSFVALFNSSNKDSCSSTLIKPLQSHEGEQIIIYNELDTQSLAALFKLSLVRKFSHGRPSMASLQRDYCKLDLKGSFTILQLHPHYVLLRFHHEEDLMRIWVKGQLSLQGMTMHIFKQIEEFHVSVQPSVVSVWISLENLPVYLFQKEVLFFLARAVGNPLKLD